MFCDLLLNEKLKVFDILTTLRECLPRYEKFCYCSPSVAMGDITISVYAKNINNMHKFSRAFRNSAAEGPKKINIIS